MLDKTSCGDDNFKESGEHGTPNSSTTPLLARESYWQPTVRQGGEGRTHDDDDGDASDTAAKFPKDGEKHGNLSDMLLTLSSPT